VLVGLAVVRAIAYVVAIPLAPVLYHEDERIALLVLLRPAKEVLLLAGYVARDDGVEVLVLSVFASIPLLVLTVWLFFALGRAYRREIADAELPGVAGRVLPSQRIADLQDGLRERGRSFVVLGRMAMLPSTLVAAAAGSAGMRTAEFLVADAVGAAASLVVVLGAGWLLGEAYETAGPWLSVLGALALFGAMLLVGRQLTGGGRGRAARHAPSPA
jgi:membrane protein DedA with SNARE-associated domain